jgi:hypothetical protein
MLSLQPIKRIPDGGKESLTPRCENGISRYIPELGEEAKQYHP